MARAARESHWAKTHDHGLWHDALRQLLQGAAAAGATRPAPIAGSKSTARDGETRTPEFLAKNSERQGADAGTRRRPRRCPSRTRSCATWPKARAILPDDRWQRAQACSGCSSSSTATSRTSPSPASSRSWLPADHPRRAELPRLRERGDQALAVMEQHLRPRMVHRRSATASPISRCTPTPTYAACGGIDLARYPGDPAWLARVEAQPGFCRPMRY